MDLSKAFETINYHILIEKSNAHVVRGNSVKLVRDYLCKKYPVAKGNGTTRLNFRSPLV